ncbi:MAG TPA: hypothetical protein VFX96_06135 [Pyrinomonadaceae bacterium]|nr:hypothetical protein [Pyrinomonadaceae bacterium]
MNWMRTAVLTVLVVSLVALGLPVEDSLARWSRRASVSHRRGNHRFCRHSRAWWRRHRARARERQERARLRRQQREAALSARVRDTDKNSTAAALSPRAARKARAAATRAPQVQGPQNPYDFARPTNWNLARVQAPGSLTFSVAPQAGGKSQAQATLAPVVLTGAGAAADVISPRSKTLGGVALPALRRTVIERMIAEGGWVANDMERQFQGRRVYIVVAHTGQAGVARQSWTFYFTEIDGQLYSLATTAPVELAAPVAADAERVMASLKRGNVAAGQSIVSNQKR